MKHDLENFFLATLITSVLVVCFLALKGLTFTPASMQQKSMIADSRSFSLGLQISPSNKKKINSCRNLQTEWKGACITRKITLSNGMSIPDTIQWISAITTNLSIMDGHLFTCEKSTWCVWFFLARNLRQPSGLLIFLQLVFVKLSYRGCREHWKTSIFEITTSFYLISKRNVIPERGFY